MSRIVYPDGTIVVSGKSLTKEDIRASNVALIESAPISDAEKAALVVKLPCGQVFTDIAEIQSLSDYGDNP